MKLIYHGEEVEFDDVIEPGEIELDKNEVVQNLEDTIELTNILQNEIKKEILLEKTREFYYE